MRVYAFVDAQKTDFTIATLCRVCGVSTSGFYDWVERMRAGPSSAERDDAQVLARIRAAANVATRTTIVLSTPYENRPVT